MFRELRGRVCSRRIFQRML